MPLSFHRLLSLIELCSFGGVCAEKGAVCFPAGLETFSQLVGRDENGTVSPGLIP